MDGNDVKRDPLGARRFRRLARRRKDFAWWPHDSRTPEYLYRPGELLVAADAADQARAVLKDIGAGAEETRRRDNGLVRFIVTSRIGVPDLIEEIEDTAPELAGQLTPNHWFVAAPYRHFGPGDEPSVPRSAHVDIAKEGGEGARVAVVDSGFLKDAGRHHWLAHDVSVDAADIENPDLDRNGFLDFDAGHGTFVAGCVRQVAPGAALAVEQVIDRHGLVSEEALAEQVLQALAKQPHVLNLSLGGYTRDDRVPLGLAVWEKQVRDNPSLVVVAAAGNDSTDDRFYPAALPWVVGVGATNADGTAPAAFSNFGEWVDCCARGEGLVNAYATGRYRTERGEVRSFDGLAAWSGTSFAAPLVAGAIAARMDGGRLSPAEARNQVLAEAGPVIGGIGPYVAT